MASITPLRTLRGSLAASSSSRFQFARSVSTSYQPISNNDPSINYPARPPRPQSPSFFTGKPTYYSAVDTLEKALSNAQSSLRQERIFPFPSHLPALQPPRASWLSAPALGNLLQTNLKTSSHRRILELLNELHMLRHVATVCDLTFLQGTLHEVLQKYERESGREVDGTAGEGGELQVDGQTSKLDKYGRAYGMGRRKDASARVWIIPTKTAKSLLSDPSAASTLSPSSPSSPSSSSLSSSAPSPGSPLTLDTIGTILVNHLPMSQHFARQSEHDTILRPFRLTGLLGAFNVFALVRGGGTSGQAGALALGLSRALAAARPETHDVLYRDGALMRDTRMVERKKTGKAKARKKYAWVKR